MIKIKIGSKISEDQSVGHNNTDNDLEDMNIAADDDEGWKHNPTIPQNADKQALNRIPKFVQKIRMYEPLIERGYIPIVGSEHGINHLGKGKQGQVLEVTKNDKRYAAKIGSIAGLEAQREMIIRTKIEEIRPQMPPEVSKHIIQCYDIFRKADLNYYIMEIMRPMTKMEETILYKRNFTNRAKE